MSYDLSIQKKGETAVYSGKFYTEEDLIKFLKDINNGFAVFEGVIIEGGYKTLSKIQIIFKNYDGVTEAGEPANFWPFTQTSINDYSNRAGVFQENGISGPIELDVSEEYIMKYLVGKKNITMLKLKDTTGTYNAKTQILLIGEERINISGNSKYNIIVRLYLEQNISTMDISELSEIFTGRERFSEKDEKNTRNYIDYFNEKNAKNVEKNEIIGIEGKVVVKRFPIGLENSDSD